MDERLRIEVIKEAEEFSKIGKQWDLLTDELGKEVSVFASFAWYETWWKHFGAGSSLNIIVMWEGNRLVGAAPLMLRKTTVHGMPVKAVTFIENRQGLHNDFLVFPEYRQLFFLEMLRMLDRDPSLWDLMVFRNLPDVSVGKDLFTRILTDQGRNWRQSSTWYDSPYLAPSGDWSDYLATRSTRTRKSLRNIRNTMEKAGDVLVRNIRTWDDFVAVKDDFFRVAKGSWAEQGGDSIASAANEEFFLDLSHRAAEKGWLSLWTLELNGKMIAIEYHLRGFSREHALRGHYLLEFADLSPGTYLEMQILKQVFSETDKVDIYDFCGSFESYKRKWTDSYVPHWDFTVFGTGIYGRCLAFHETMTVPLLKKVFPQRLWDSRLFRLCGIKTDRMSG